MEFKIILQIIFFGLALAMDAFVASIISGLVYSDINKKKVLLIATTFGLMQGFMPLISYFAIEFVTFLVGTTAGQQAGEILANVVKWISFGLLLIIALKMIIQAILDLKRVKETHCHKCKTFSYKEVFMLGVATSIDALALGVSLHGGISQNNTIFLHVGIIILITFVLSIIGVLFGHIFEKLLKGKYEICSIIAGAILVGLAIWILL